MGGPGGRDGKQNKSCPGGNGLRYTAVRGGGGGGGCGVICDCVIYICLGGGYN